MEWSARRRLVYVSSIFIPLFLVAMALFFFWWYEEPTCFDGKQNGDEIGRDCGGSCRLLCSSQALPAEVLWSRAFEIVPGVYNLVAYIENPNIRSEVESVTYTFKVYDQNNELFLERKGVTDIPQRETFAIFEGTVRMGESVPSRVTFEFTSDLLWQKVYEAEPAIDIETTVLVGSDSSPRIDAILENNSPISPEETEVTAIVYDSNNNAIHASRTIVEDFIRDTRRSVTFTWPQPFDAGVGVCATPVDVALVIDRSGSMNDDSLTPPEPLTTVKNAAGLFAQAVTTEDRLAIVSFATEGSLDSMLTSNMQSIAQAISSIAIQGEDTTQQTNIFDGLSVALGELGSERDRADADNIIVLLTDGIPSRPLETGNPDYAEEVTQTIADQIRQAGTEMYTIGLGANVNNEFLQNIATEEEYYYPAPTSEDLNAIYEQIATAICKKGPNVIQIIPRIIQ